MPISCHFRDCKLASGHEFTCKQRYSKYPTFTFYLYLFSSTAVDRRILLIVQMAWEYIQTHLERFLALCSSLLCNHAALHTRARRFVQGVRFFITVLSYRQDLKFIITDTFLIRPLPQYKEGYCDNSPNTIRYKQFNYNLKKMVVETVVRVFVPNIGNRTRKSR